MQPKINFNSIQITQQFYCPTYLFNQFLSLSFITGSQQKFSNISIYNSSKEMGSITDSIKVNQPLPSLKTIDRSQFSNNQDIQTEYPLSQFTKSRCEPIIASKNLMSQQFNQLIKIDQQDKWDYQEINLESVRLRVSQHMLMPVFQVLSRVKMQKPAFQMIKIDAKRFLKMKSTPINKDYEFIKEIGRGGFGLVYKAKDKKNNEVRAIKKIDKKSLTAQQKYNLANQFDILSSLDHPNIIKLYDIYNDPTHFYVVTQLCEGGDLLHFVNEKVLTQKMMRSVMVQLISAVKYMHNLQILHRDIKLENLVLVKKITNEEQKMQIKLIDFGISIQMDKVSPAEIDQAGTLLYMPPECFKDVKTLALDVWSCGITLYMMSTRKRPYRFKNDSQLIQKIKKGDIIRSNLQKLPFDLKVFIMILLDAHYQSRITAARALDNIWLKKQPQKSSITISTRFKAAKNLLDYDAQNNLVSIIEAYLIYKKVNQEQRQRLASIFQEIDEDKSGVIEIEELKKFYSQNSQHYDSEDVEVLLSTMDKNKSGKIDFNEFITAMCDRRELFQLHALEQAFDYFDKDKSGQISKKELQAILIGIQREQIQYLFSQLDKNNDYKISKKQFISYLSNGKS